MGFGTLRGVYREIYIYCDRYSQSSCFPRFELHGMAIIGKRWTYIKTCFRSPLAQISQSRLGSIDLGPLYSTMPCDCNMKETSHLFWLKQDWHLLAYGLRACYIANDNMDHILLFVLLLRCSQALPLFFLFTLYFDVGFLDIFVQTFRVKLGNRFCYFENSKKVLRLILLISNCNPEKRKKSE